MPNPTTFKEYYKKNKREEFGSIYNFIVIMRYLEKYEGYDFSKHPQNKLEKFKNKKYIMKSGGGKEYYL